ncbi:MAG: hypothetical protein QNJ56_05870 [Gammaproteobacteria bacterium]|nr:hypothetical protein [Gammaproteobacteria bacterium]
MTGTPIQLSKTLGAIDCKEFNQIFKKEAEQLGLEHLPLQAALSGGNYALEEGISIMVNQVNQTGTTIEIRAGVFFNSVIAGCNCADDPTPIDQQPEYCELAFCINRADANTTIRIIH